ncbi:MAG: hypothetical protein ISR43_05545 [Acidimicrobiia bacterium]|nr:hypothetical protein [Actinomycetota bacterium]MBL6924854.1 hypothetical protein [Acidimicrobiia bacterium]MBL6926676.1 hypothetical protein [Acidimicrobiia bacterium]
MRIRLVARLMVAILGRPRLWPVAVRQANRLAVPGWWRHPPFLPLPDRRYAGFRTLTQYGDSEHEPDVADVLVWLTWCAEMERGI